MKQKPLARKSSLKAKTSLKPSKSVKKQVKPPLTKLRKQADKLFSRMVRLRDCEPVGAEFHGICITCSYARPVAWIDEKGTLRFYKGWDAGHYISRGNNFLRYDEENVNLQDSYRCNRMRSGEHEKYKVALDAKYGDGTHAKLDKLAAENKDYKLTRADYEQVIADSLVQIEFYESMIK